jgi:hypothetical protein
VTNAAAEALDGLEVLAGVVVDHVELATLETVDPLVTVLLDLPLDLVEVGKPLRQ